MMAADMEKELHIKIKGILTIT